MLCTIYILCKLLLTWSFFQTFNTFWFNLVKYHTPMRCWMCVWCRRRETGGARVCGGSWAECGWRSARCQVPRSTHPARVQTQWPLPCSNTARQHVPRVSQGTHILHTTVNWRSARRHKVKWIVMLGSFKPIIYNQYQFTLKFTTRKFRSSWIYLQYNLLGSYSKVSFNNILC